MRRLIATIWKYPDFLQEMSGILDTRIPTYCNSDHLYNAIIHHHLGGMRNPGRRAVLSIMGAAALRLAGRNPHLSSSSLWTDISHTLHCLYWGSLCIASVLAGSVRGVGVVLLCTMGQVTGSRISNDVTIMRLEPKSLIIVFYDLNYLWDYNRNR